MSQIKVTNLSKTFRIPREKRNTLKENFVQLFRRNQTYQLQVLKDINFEIHRGEFFGIIGPNGSGKSTLLKLLSNIYQPDQGKIETQAKIAPFLELGIGFQQDLTARENIFINAALLGMTEKQARQKLPNILDFAELHAFADLRVKNFSSGMRSRLAFAIATQVDADVYLCDEIFAVGDESFQQKSLEVFKMWHQQGKTIILVSHNTDLIFQYCQRALYLNHGCVQALGTPGDVINQYHQDIIVQSAERNEHRIDNSPARLTKIEALHTPRTGDPLTLRIHYHTTEPIRQPVFGLAIHDEQGTHLTGPNTKTSKHQIPQISGQGCIECTIPNLSLLAGNYLVSASLFDNDLTRPFAYLDKQFVFTVEPNRDNQYGVVDLSVNWDVKLFND